MTTQQIKELAEWAAEWLELEKTDQLRDELQRNGPWMLGVKPFPGVYLTAINFFETATAPILAALAKRKMEELGFFVSITNTINESGEHNGYSCLIGPWSKGSSIRIDNENEYIALWLAIREAVKA